MLNTACRARSEVGRVSSPSGAASLTPLWFPASIRIGAPRAITPGRQFHRRSRRRLQSRFRLLAEAELFLDHLANHLFHLALLEMAELEGTIGETNEPADRPAE